MPTAPAPATSPGVAPGTPPLPASFRIVLDRRVRAEGDTVVGGSPPRLLRLSPGGRRALDTLVAGATVGEAGPGAGVLARRLCATGIAHPLPPALPGRDAAVTAVVPVHNRAGALAPLVAGLRRTVGVREVVVVDDGSSDGSAAAAQAAGARVLRHPRRVGPARARNNGIRAACTDVVALVDSDCRPSADWLQRLVAHLADPAVAAAAPRLRGDAGVAGSWTGRYEAACCPLDAGPEPGAVRPGSRVPYVPAATLVARRSALLQVGGFDEALRFGEDVDLVWRLIDQGWTVRYDPAACVVHDTRAGLPAWLAQRFGYGTSGGPLSRRHPGRLAPFEASPMGLAPLALAAAGHPVGAAAIVLCTAAAVARRAGGPGAGMRLAASGHARAAQALARASTRVWLPLAGALALTSRRGRAALLAAVTLPALADWARLRPAIDPLRFALLRLLEDAAYCAGVWAGAARERTPAPLLPRIRRRGQPAGRAPSQRSPAWPGAAERRDTGVGSRS